MLDNSRPEDRMPCGEPLVADDMEKLAEKTCVPCRGGVPPLTESEARQMAAGAPGWRLEENGTRLSRRFEFRDFVEAMKFVNRVADIAEREGHHPDIAIHWTKVDLTLWTHKIGGLHENDFILAAKVNRLLEDDPDATVIG
jgi:4a-hydroxytetrahydrobiopterin dehydratase